MKSTGRAKLMSASRAYFYDVDTGEEILSGACAGRSESGIYNGARFTDTVLEVFFHDLATREGFRAKASDFPGRRVMVKLWHGENHFQWSALVDEAKGWKGNEADFAGIPRRELGTERIVREMFARQKASYRYASGRG